MLDQIIAHTRKRGEAAETARPYAQLMKEVDGESQPYRPRSLVQSLNRCQSMAVIAEVKRASPSKGALNMTLNPPEQAAAYEQAGAAAISVLTEPAFFKGKEADLLAVRQRVSCPVLRKDFLLTPYQLLESRWLQADVVLLIAAALPGRQLATMHRLAMDLGLQCLLEVHGEEEVAQVLDLPLRQEADVIGINNRNLRTFQVSLETTRRLRPLMPAEMLCISESGITTPQEVTMLQNIDIQGILVGEALVTARDPRQKLAWLVGT